MLNNHLIATKELIVRITSFRGLLIWGCLTILLIGCVVRDIDPETGEVIIEDQQVGFDATEYVNEIWQDKLILTVREEAKELGSLMEEINKENEQSAGNQLSVSLVKGTGEVIEVDTTSRVGYILVDVSSPTEVPNVRLLIGPVISGTALRDALPFISFDQFNNQIEYAAVSRALHNRLLESELDLPDNAGLEGREIRFNGAALFENNQVLITPVEIEVQNHD